MKKIGFLKMGCFLASFLGTPLIFSAQDEQRQYDVPLTIHSEKLPWWRLWSFSEGTPDPELCPAMLRRRSSQEELKALIDDKERELDSPRMPTNEEIENLNPSMDFFARRSDAYWLGHNSQLTELKLMALTYNGYLTLKDIAKGVPFENMSHILDVFKDRGKSWGGGAFLPGLSEWRNSSEPENMDEFLAKLETVIGVVWALCHHSFKQGEGFSRGSFSIIDPQDYFWRFLQEALKTLGQANTLNELSNLSSISSAAFNFLGNNRGYRRFSSHYTNNHYFFSPDQFGIDTRFSKSCYPIPCLPFGMSHILVANIQKQDISKIFFKFEPYGLADYLNTVRHTLEYLKTAQVNHMMKREKDIPEPIAEKAYNLFETLKLLKKKEVEKLSKEVRRTLKNYNHKNTGINFFKESKNLDISTLWSWCQRGIGQDLFSIFLREIKEQLLYSYKEETLPWRTGNERVLNFDQFALSEPEDFGLNHPVLAQAAFPFFEGMMEYARQLEESYPSFYAILLAYSELTYPLGATQDQIIDTKLCFLSRSDNVTVNNLWKLYNGFNSHSIEIQTLLKSLEADLEPLCANPERALHQVSD